jgi:hypothetical protein
MGLVHVTAAGEVKAGALGSQSSTKQLRWPRATSPVAIALPAASNQTVHVSVGAHRAKPV